MTYKHWPIVEEIDAGYIALQLWLDSIRSSSPWLNRERQIARDLFSPSYVAAMLNKTPAPYIARHFVGARTKTIIGEIHERIKTDRRVPFLHMQEIRLSTYKHYHFHNFRSMDSKWHGTLLAFIHELEHLELWRTGKMIARGYQDGY